MSTSVPDFVVAGAGRSGTTAVVEALRVHPQAFVTEPKEPHYFALHGTRPEFAGPGDAHTINRVAVTDRKAFLDLFPRDRGEFRALGDGSVSTLYYYQRALPEILTMNPGMRFVILLRDPVARAYSSFQYIRARVFDPAEALLEA
ncbi:MAG: sulfotransferase, partial [Nocardioides sp.]|nr:sulfotransferase [Nocardioides sp.]